MEQEVTYLYRLWGKSLVIDTISRGGGVAEVVYGGAEGIGNPKMVWNPFMPVNSLDERPGVVILGTEESPLFMAATPTGISQTHPNYLESEPSNPAACIIREARVICRKPTASEMIPTNGFRDNRATV